MMDSVEIKIRPPHILLECPIHLGYKTKRFHWCDYDKRFKAFKLPFGVRELVEIKREFPEAKVVEGKEYIDRMKVRQLNLDVSKNAMTTYNSQSVFDYDFRLPPFAHQKRGLFYLQNCDGAALFADCGTGKTATSLWDVAIKYKQGLLKPSSVLIVSKLMTLFSGWYKDSKKFTLLTSGMLWEPTKGKEEKSNKQEVCDYGPKPQGKIKECRKTEYYHISTGELAILSSARKFNPKKHIRKIREWKQVGDLKYGKETLSTLDLINVRADNLKKKIAGDQSDIHIINHEGLLYFEKELTERNYDLIIIDESTVIKNPQGKIYKALLRIAENTRYRRILSGTPSPQGPQDLWSQFYFLDMGLTLGPNYKHFLQENFDMVRLGSHEAGTFAGVKPCVRKSKPGKHGTLEYIWQRTNKRVFRCRLDDCVDLPPIHIGRLDVYMSEEQQRHYKTMEESLLVELEKETVEVTIDLAKIGKLRQITGGFIINKEKDVIRLSKRNPKLEVLESFIDEIHPSEKVVIFAVFRTEIELLLKRFGKQAVAIYGGIGDKKRLQAQERFVNDASVRYIIIQPTSGAYGVDGLQAVARYLVFYSIDYRGDTNYQAIHRIKRAGQTRSMVVRYLITKNSIDETIYSSVDKKGELQQDTINNNIVKEFKIRRKHAA